MFIKSILSQLSMMMSRVKSAEVPMVPVDRSPEWPRTPVVPSPAPRCWPR